MLAAIARKTKAATTILCTLVRIQSLSRVDVAGAVQVQPDENLHMGRAVICDSMKLTHAELAGQLIMY
jgi:hypothetical protein